MLEIRYALRGLARNPGYALVAGLALALGIGANTTVFSVVNAALLRSLPYADEDRVVRVYNHWEGTPDGAISPAEHFDYLDATPGIFEAYGVYVPDPVNVSGGDRPERLQAAFVTSGALDALGVSVTAGRSLTAEDDADGGAAVVLISDGLFQSRFAGRTGAVGSELRVDGTAMTIVGILPPGFRLPTGFTGPAADLIMPIGLERSAVAARGSHYLVGVARLASGVTLDRANARIDELAAGMSVTWPDDYPRDMRFGAHLVPVRDDIAGPVRPFLLLLLGAVGLVLLVVCANVASLTLTRADTRRREFAVRTALGAGRRHVTRQLLAESLILSTGAGIAGVFLAAWSSSALIAIQPPGMPFAGGVTLDLRVLGFALAATGASALLFGLTPLLQLDRDPSATLREGGRSTTASRPRQRLRNLIVAAELALAVVLLSGAGLLVRSFVGLIGVDPGYETRNVLTSRLTLPTSSYPTDDSRRAFFRDAISRVAALPGVRAAGGVTNLPLASSLGDINIRIEGREIAEGEVAPALDWQVVTPGYFDAIGMRILSGRGILATDDERAPGAVVINQSAARELFGEADPIGTRFLLGGNAGPGWVTIVGIVGDIRHARLDRPARAEMYLPHAQFTYWNGGSAVRELNLVAATTGDPAVLAPAVRTALASLDAELPPGPFQTMTDVRAAAFSWPRFFTAVMGAFAGLALVLAAVGVYGLLSFTVRLRAHEMGIRIALGAHRPQVVGLVLRQALAPVAGGIVVGLAAARVLSGGLRSVLYGVEPGDPVTLLVVATALGAVALVACWIPAMRATRVDPMSVMRLE